MTPTWYDLLGVEPDASEAEIRAAWKAAIADLDPGDRRFRTLNEAAEVLLDDDKRAAYDATLTPEDEPAEDARGAATCGKQPRPSRPRLRRREEPPTRSRAATAGWSPPGCSRPWPCSSRPCSPSPATWSPSPPTTPIADSTSEAQAAAERAATTILAYDYRHLDEDQKAAGALMTPAYQKKYDALFSQIKENAPDVKAIVTVEVVASGIVRSEADRVQVLVFVNRPTLRADKTDPTIFRDQVVMTMEKSGDDWLVDDMVTNQLAG